MSVAIIGTGKMGSGFARLLASQGVEVIIGGRDAAKAAQLAQEVGGGARGTDIASAVKCAELIILAVYYQKMDEAIRAAGDLKDKVLVDISNPITEDFKDLLIGHQTSAAEEIQKLAPNAKVVKAYTTLLEALNRHRGKGQQKVTVEHVHVHSGGQAIVGSVQGGGVLTKSEEQPHALGYAAGETLRSENAEREAVRVTGDGKR